MAAGISVRETPSKGKNSRDTSDLIDGRKQPFLVTTIKFRQLRSERDIKRPSFQSGIIVQPNTHEVRNKATAFEN